MSDDPPVVDEMEYAAETDAPAATGIVYAYTAEPDPGVLPLDLEMLEEEQGTEGVGEVPPPDAEETDV